MDLQHNIFRLLNLLYAISQFSDHKILPRNHTHPVQYCPVHHPAFPCRYKGIC